MIGKTISHYKILEKLGEGGMGVVYKAQDTNLDRFVALKFLPQHLTTSEEEKQRFIHEAKAASSLDHTNICNIYEIDETEDGQLFISMAYYEGQTLEDKIKDERLKINEAVDYAIQIANGLNKAHQKGIIHRDIKPANIIVTDDNVVKILDFGLAKLSTQTKLTKEGTTLGTIAYMSPEQTRGEAVDHRSDIWSLGVIIYEMISGQLPFKGDYDQAVMYGITNETPEPLTGLRTGVPLELERIVNRMLAKDPQDRYQHADDLLSELNRLKKNSDSETTPQIKPEFPKKKSKSIAIPVIVLSIIVLIIAGYLLLKPIQLEKVELPASEWENSIAVLPIKNISADPEQEYFCDGMTDQIISNIANLPQLKVISRTSVMKYKKTDKTIPDIGKELNVAYVLEGSVQKLGERIRVIAQLIGTKDDFHLWAEKYDRDYQELFDIQDDVSNMIASSLLQKLSEEEVVQIKTTRPENTEAYEYYLKGKHIYVKYLDTFVKEDIITAEKMLKMALTIDPNFAETFALLADLYNTYYNMYAKNDEERNKYMQLQEDYLDTAFQLNPNSSQVFSFKGWVHRAKADKYYYEKQYDKCEPELEKAFSSLKRAIKISRNNDAAYDGLGMFYYDKGLIHLANKCLDKAIKLNPLQLQYYWYQAWCYIFSGEYNEAEQVYIKALEIQSDNRWVLTNYLRMQVLLGKIEESQKLLSQLEKHYPEVNFDLFYARIYALKGEKEKALASYIKKDVQLYALLGMREETIAILFETQKRNRVLKDSMFHYLQTPYYDKIRSDPRFQEILKEYKEIYEENLRKYGDIEL